MTHARMAINQAREVNQQNNVENELFEALQKLQRAIEAHDQGKGND